MYISFFSDEAESKDMSSQPSPVKPDKEMDQDRVHVSTRVV